MTVRGESLPTSAQRPMRSNLKTEATFQRLLAPQTRLALALPPLLIGFLILGVLSLGLGSVVIAPLSVLQIVWDRVVGQAITPDLTYSAAQATIVLELRLPRFLVGALVGSALACSGVVFQGLFRNPMGDPYLLGVAPGAGLGATTILLFGAELGLGAALPLGLSALPIAAFLGGSLATAIIYSLASQGGRTPVGTLLLAGVAVGSLLSALTSFMMYARPDRLQQTMLWLFGSLSKVGWGSLWTMLPYAIIGLLLIATQTRALNLLLLDEEQARSLGIEVERTKIVLVGASTLLTAAAVAVSGLIGFVGLVAPHIARLIFGADNRVLIPTSALTGALFLTSADLLARTLFSPAEVPVGIVCAIFGGPFFLWLLRRRKRQGAL